MTHIAFVLICCNVKDTNPMKIMNWFDSNFLINPTKNSRKNSKVRVTSSYHQMLIRNWNFKHEAFIKHEIFVQLRSKMYSATIQWRNKLFPKTLFCQSDFLNERRSTWNKIEKKAPVRIQGSKCSSMCSMIYYT